MKKHLLLLFSVIIFTSCTKMSYMQICDINSTNVPIKNESFLYSDDACRVYYNFWGDYGNPGFLIENLTDSILFINLGQSYFVINGRTNDYFLNREWQNSSSSTNATISSYSRGASVFGYWKNIHYYNYPGSISESLGLSYMNSFTNTSGILYHEKEIISIPAQGYRVVSEYSILNDVIQSCSLKMFPSRDDCDSLVFTDKTSPVSFRNVISYSVGTCNKVNVISNDFYISRISNYRQKDIEKESKDGCYNQNNIVVNKLANRKRFYVTYTEFHDNAYSADAKKQKEVKFYETKHGIKTPKYSVRR